MGLDLIISEQHNLTTDEKDRTTWQVTCLGIFHNCWNFLEYIQNYANLQNCTTVNLDGDKIQKILDDMQDIVDDTNEEPDIEGNPKLVEELEYVRQVIKDGEIQLDNEHTYEIHAGW